MIDIEEENEELRHLVVELSKTIREQQIRLQQYEWVMLQQVWEGVEETLDSYDKASTLKIH